MKLEIGQAAPSFKSFDTEKNEVNLSDFKGQPVVLLFFPFAFTGVCTTELCSVRDTLSWYNQLNVTVLGLSVDSLFSLKKFKEEQNLNFTLVSDFNKTISTDYGALYESFGGWMNGVSKRAAFVIDGNGKIAHAQVLENAGELPDFTQLKNVLEKL